MNTYGARPRLVSARWSPGCSAASWVSGPADEQFPAVQAEPDGHHDQQDADRDRGVMMGLAALTRPGKPLVKSSAPVPGPSARSGGELLSAQALRCRV